jgi:hypothetical protein
MVWACSTNEEEKEEEEEEEERNLLVYWCESQTERND